MKIRSLSSILYFPLFVATIVILYFGYGSNDGLLVWILLPVILTIAIYVGQGQIDYWWLKSNPAPLDERIENWLTKHSDYYTSLNESYKLEYRNRLSNYLFAREFMVVGNKEQREAPEDIKAIIASQAINLTFGDEDYLLDDYDRIFLYTHPFPSPRFKFLHTVETEHVDKTIILSMDHAVHGIVKPMQHYNIALHAFADAYTHAHPEKDYPPVHQLGWEAPEQILRMNKDHILKTCGFDHLDLLVVHIVAYFTDEIKYKELCPLETVSFERVFNQAKILV